LLWAGREISQVGQECNKPFHRSGGLSRLPGHDGEDISSQARRAKESRKIIDESCNSMHGTSSRGDVFALENLLSRMPPGADIHCNPGRKSFLRSALPAPVPGIVICGTPPVRNSLAWSGFPLKTT